MSDLNYVPSWLDDANTLLEKLNKCIDKIVSIVTALTAADKTANDALSLAKTNEADIALNEADITELQGKVNDSLSRLTVLSNAIDTAVSIANTAQTTAEERQEQLYLHRVSMTLPNNAVITFYDISNVKERYADKIKKDEEFNITLNPLNIECSAYGGASITCLNAVIAGSITLTRALIDGLWQTQCNGVLSFVAYLDNNNQIQKTDEYEWYDVTVLNDSAIKL